MPIGNPSKQTIATQKYTKKVGLVSKSYKLRQDLVEQFAQACERAGVSQAKQLSVMMQEFVDEQKNYNLHKNA